MTNSHDHAECAHSPCACKVDSVGEYCSDYCKAAMTSTDCGCGHPECNAIA